MHTCICIRACVLWSGLGHMHASLQSKKMHQNYTLIPCSFCRLHGNLLWVVFAVWNLIKNGWGLLLSPVLSWSSACNEDQTEGAGKHSGRFTDFIIGVVPGWSCVRSFNLIPGTNKRINSQFERPRRTCKLMNLVNEWTKAFRQRLLEKKKDFHRVHGHGHPVNFDVLIHELMANMRANADHEANTDVPKAPSQYKHSNLWTLKLVKISLKLITQPSFMPYV